MKVVLDENLAYEQLEVIIKCKTIDESVLQILAAIRQNDKKLVGYEEGQMCVIAPEEIFYFESVDKKNFIYTENKVYETPLKLYEIEEMFIGGDFFRASKASIINLSKIQSLIYAFNGKIEVTLENNEKLLVSRKYVDYLKIKLGL
ncbi:MAG: LytTR family DNA-binding domain-containing protein [Cellulosilyticaceae bacterium]